MWGWWGPCNVILLAGYAATPGASAFRRNRRSRRGLLRPETPKTHDSNTR
jgi:hypothetical protein